MTKNKPLVSYLCLLIVAINYTTLLSGLIIIKVLSIFDKLGS